ncbi:MAG: hypothetical protein R6U67_14965 [Sodalinema sp.]|uniref:hypothetical protein n=1 Tax=Sodalinema sp. TaxID=3080550 RepID=UPI00396F45A0
MASRPSERYQRNKTIAANSSGVTRSVRSLGGCMMGAIVVASLFDLADTSGLASIVLGGWSGDRWADA